MAAIILPWPMIWLTVQGLQLPQGLRQELVRFGTPPLRGKESIDKSCGKSLNYSELRFRRS